MSNTFKKKYNSFSREILSEFLPEKELKKLDRMYSEVKMLRMIRRFNRLIKK